MWALQPPSSPMIYEDSLANLASNLALLPSIELALCHRLTYDYIDCFDSTDRRHCQVSIHTAHCIICVLFLRRLLCAVLE